MDRQIYPKDGWMDAGTDLRQTMAKLFLYLQEVEDGLLCTFLRLLLKTEVF